MDPSPYETIRQAVGGGISLDTIVIATLVAVIGGINALILAFMKKKGESFATKTDVAFLQAQLKENTRLTETIKQDVTKEYSLWQSRFDFKRRQIDEFYGPLLFLIERANWIQQQRNHRMQLALDEHGGQSDEWAAILRAFTNDYILPIRSEIADLLRAKSFLMEERHESVAQFLRHDAEDRPLYTLWNKHSIDGRIRATEWPASFETEIRGTKERLERELRIALDLPAISPGPDLVHSAASNGHVHEMALTRKFVKG
jgi:hypothetical protein